MAGAAKSTQFNIGTATVMVGPMDQVLDLTPEQHSLGLIKAFNINTENTEVELTQELRNTVVDSQVTGVDITASFEMYEYTTTNLAYAAMLDGNEYSTGQEFEISEPVVGGVSATSVKLKSETDLSTTFVAGSPFQMQMSSTGKYDKVFIGEVASATYDSTEKVITVTLASPISEGWSFAAGDKFFTVSIIPLGADKPQPYLGMKIVGVLPSAGNAPVTIIIPRAKFSSGFALGFNTDAYANMPIEVTPYDLTATDAMYEKFAKYKAPVFVYTG